MAAAVYDFADGFTFTGAKSETVGPKKLLGGKYAVFASAADTSDTFQFELPDNSTFQNVGTSTTATTAAFFAVVDLPPGTYQFVIVSATNAVQGGVVKIPYNPSY